MTRTRGEIAGALARRDALARRLARMDRAIAIAGRQFSAQEGYRVPLPLPALRREVGA